MAKQPLKRVSVDVPLVREYPIVACELFRSDESITICSYLKPQRTGEKTPEGKDKWEDKVFKEWVLNTGKIDLVGMKIIVETRIA